jgi:hypothetical protein
MSAYSEDLRENNSHLAWLGATAIFQAIRLSGGGALANLVYRPSQIKHLEVHLVQGREPSG